MEIGKGRKLRENHFVHSTRLMDSSFKNSFLVIMNENRQITLLIYQRNLRISFLWNTYCGKLLLSIYKSAKYLFTYIK